MDSIAEASVVIVGAGPVGLTMAAELARHGVRPLVVDRSDGPAGESRAVAIHTRTLEVFATMGIASAVLEAGHRIHGASIFAEGRRILHFSFDELASAFPFAVDLPQSETQRILIAHLAPHGIEVEYGVNVVGVDQNEESVTLYLHGGDNSQRTVCASYVVGCDGASSTVRHAMRLPFETNGAEETFLVADVPMDWDNADDEWHSWLHEDGLFTLFPLGGGRYRVVADSPGELEADAAALRTLFERRGPRNATIGEPIRISTYRVSHRRLATYQRGRVFVAGDAAHVHSPAGGQGMNTGIQDAHNLAWKLAMVLRGKAPDTLLESYTAEREPVSQSVVELTGDITSLATLRHPISQKIRNRLIPILGGIEVLEQRLVNRVAEMSVNYRRSPAVGQSGRWFGSGPMPGDRAADAVLPDARRLSDYFRDTRHVVLLFGAEHRDKEDMRNFGNIARYMRDGYGGEVVTYLVSREPADWGGEVIGDFDGAVHLAYAAGVPCVYLIRPDGYVGFRSLGSDPLPVLEHLNRVYEPPLPEPTMP